MVKCVSYVTVRGGPGVLPQKIFGFSGVKSCHFRQKNIKIALLSKPGIVCMTIWKLGFGFDKYLNYLYIIRASAASQKKNSENKIKTTLGPPLLSIKLRDKTPPLTNLKGGSGSPVPPPSGSAHGFWTRSRKCKFLTDDKRNDSQKEGGTDDGLISTMDCA